MTSEQKERGVGTRRARRERAIDDLLVDVCAGRPPRLPAGDEVAGEVFDEIVRATRFHRIAPLTQVALREQYPEAAKRLRGHRDHAMLHHLRTMAALGGIAKALDGIPWLTFKGPVLSELAHPLPGLRSYADLDLLLAPEDLRAGCERLAEAGWTITGPEAALRFRPVNGEISLVGSDGTVLDLHWAMINPARRRSHFTVSTGSLLARRVPVTLGPTRAWTLDDADALVHVCMHAALAGANRLGHLLDADQLARQTEDWDAIARRAREWSATPQVALVLGRASRLLGTPVPDDLRRRLGLSSAFEALTATVDRHWPVHRLRHDASVPRLVARGARDGALRSLASIGRNGFLGIVDRVRPLTSAPPPVPPGAPPRRTPVDPHAVEDYLAAVEDLAHRPGGARSRPRVLRRAEPLMSAVGPTRQDA
ncbi:nucleotidyltransferase family protein [Nocardioides sp. YIM 152315]|uniref:nucleotidyltransferase domain-containing protein n=1 Tax=Nocardioides sp. YIM 152315 TaxID=3031760 RepID=UPI0023DC3D96|nr:nucleotidyltransferase family protein [Nocardioides sp. YIM 152315]MDF1603441.1 nucleotidyltransferase family protein [Nocardioides sp. YIM 152315]